MKKISYLSIMCLLLLFTGCGIGNNSNKTIYKVNEEAFIDQYQITCTKYNVEEQLTESIDGELLTVNFTITNNSNENLEFNLEDAFQLQMNDDTTIGSDSDQTISLNANETTEVEVLFKLDTNDPDVPTDKFTVLFYSGVVTNNVGFILE